MISELSSFEKVSRNETRHILEEHFGGTSRVRFSLVLEHPVCSNSKEREIKRGENDREKGNSESAAETKRREAPRGSLFPHARQFAAAISGYGLIIAVLRTALFFFPFPLIFSFVRGSVSPRRDPLEVSCTPIRSGLRCDMAAFDLPRSSSLLLITLYVTSLTSSVNAAAAGTSSVPSAPDHDPSTRPPSPTVEPPDATGGKKTLVSILVRTARMRISRLHVRNCAEFVP